MLNIQKWVSSYDKIMQEALKDTDCSYKLASILCSCTGIAQLGTNIVKYLTKGMTEESFLTI